MLAGEVAVETLRNRVELVNELGQIAARSETREDEPFSKVNGQAGNDDHAPSAYDDIPSPCGDKRVNLTKFDSDFQTAYTLYVAAGLSITEISQLVENEEQEVRRGLASHGLL